MVTNKVIDFIYDTHGRRIMEWNHDLLSPARLQTYADAVYAKGAALENCFGFVDGTVRPIARPGENQRVVYNGHKRIHALKFQSLALPNGIIANMCGPVEGKKHDASMLGDSGLLQQLQQYAHSPAGHPMCIYGDPAYPLRLQLQAPFRNVVLTPQIQAFNSSMSSVNFFKFLDFKKNLKIGLSNIGKLYIVCAVFQMLSPVYMAILPQNFLICNHPHYRNILHNVLGNV
ncbi:PREDICTED: uncharacterized protein LOC107352684 [Acropora digitifera]|uniref:uncharacterized protein LOC107352684 n=1 Tax=Acropora digitifera TaxID=70779 RepID=UPI00077A91A3|nr:PREDICTED: uncharacterized protein LOC107352684 [Acropora digitifera]